MFNFIHECIGPTLGPRRDVCLSLVDRCGCLPAQVDALCMLEKRVCVDLMDSEYHDIVRALPRPGWLDCLRFVWHVSGAHSWYKHLPCESTVPFAFYLDPHAGMRLVITDTGERAFVQIGDQSKMARQTTDRYRTRFGHWTYYAPYGTSLRFRGEGGIVTTERRAVVLTDEGQWLQVPDALRELGTAMVNAFVHESRLTRPFFRFHVRDKVRDEGSLTQQLQRCAVQHESELKSVCGELSDELAVVVSRWCDVLLGQTKTFRSWFWRDRQVARWLEELDRAGALAHDVPTVFATLQSELTEKVRSAPEEGRVCNETCASIVTIRLYQVWSMWLAARRFESSIFDDVA